MAKTDLTAQRLRELVSYDPETGLFIWLPRALSAFASLRSHAVWHARYAGKQAGGFTGPGYVTINGITAHRLAWLYVYGQWPAGEIDHINGVRTDNRISNLRDVDRKTNAQNLRRMAKESGTPMGVFFNARKRERAYSANLKIDGRTKHLGYFDTPEMAHAAYLDAKRTNHVGNTL